MTRNTLPVDELEMIASTDVGEALRRTRVHFGKSLEEVEKDLCIRASQIGAIERGDLESLPGRVYAIGFVRSYAEYLKLDGAEAVHLFKAQYMDEHDRPSILSFPVPASETKMPAWSLVFLFLGIFFVFASVWNTLHTADRTLVEQVASLPEHAMSDSTPGGEPIAQPDAQEAVQDTEMGKSVMGPELERNEGDNVSGTVTSAGAPDTENGVVLKIYEDSWVEIKDDTAQVLVSKVLEKGDEYFVPNHPGLSMSLGNAGSVEIVLNGRALMPLGKSGEVRRDIPLDTEYLKTLSFKAQGVIQNTVPQEIP